MPSPKRFIAGAECPQCKQLDKIRRWRDGDVLKTECVSCDFSDEMNANANPKDEVQIIKIGE